MAVLAHLPGAALVAILLAMDVPLSLPVALLAVSFSAALLAWGGRLPIWWRYINLLFLPLLAAAFYLQLYLDSMDPNWFLAAFLLLALTSMGAVRTRVPLYLSSPRAADELALRLPEQGRLIDLGCGWGGPLARIHQQRPDVILAGVEAAPLNWLITKFRLSILGAKADIRLGSLWEVDLSDFDIVYAYLSPAPMPRLWEKARREMKAGSLFISNTFAISATDCHLNADEIIDLSQPGDLTHARLLIWRL
jgi:hypothetical protein